MARKKRIDVPFILLNNKYGTAEYLRLYDDEIVKANLTPAQQNCFLLYCVEFGNFMQMELDLIKEGVVITAGNKTKIPNPKYNMKLSSFKAVMTAATQLGLTPKSKIKSTGKAKMSMLDSLKNKAKNG